MTTETEAIISDRTRITLGLATAILGLSFWIGMAWAQIVELKLKVDTLQSIDRRLSRIEGKLGVAEK